jgi:hypothetical protein
MADSTTSFGFCALINAKSEMVRLFVVNAAPARLVSGVEVPPGFQVKLIAAAEAALATITATIAPMLAAISVLFRTFILLILRRFIEDQLTQRPAGMLGEDKSKFNAKEIFPLESKLSALMVSRIVNGFYKISGKQGLHNITRS